MSVPFIVRRFGGTLLALAATGIVSCTTSPPDEDGAAPRYEVTATVLQAPDEPAMLCLGAILTSYPPQCGTVPIPNWDWVAVDDEARAAGVTWGEWHLVGTFDGETFTLVDPPEVPRSSPQPPRDEFLSPCPEPAGGWRPVDPSRTTDGAMSEVLKAAKARPGFAGAWFDQLDERPGGRNDPHRIVINAAFTGNLETHERALREIWGGALCVSHHDHTEERLREIQDELMGGTAEEAGLLVLSAGVDVIDNVVALEVAVADPAAAAALDERYGEGVVRISGTLQPV